MMPDIEALQELIAQMGEMDYESLKKKKGMPGMVKIEIETEKPEGMGQMSDEESEVMPGMGQESDEEKLRKMERMRMMGR